MSINTPTTIVLVDPTSADGETALELLDDDDTHVSLVVLLTGRASAALREYSRVEDIDLATAGWTYLEQVADRIADGRTVEVIAAHGPDTAFELGTLAAARPTSRVLLPASIERLEPNVTLRLSVVADGAVHVAAPVGAR